MLTVASLLLVLAGQVDPSLSYSQLELHTLPGDVDRWTVRETGCPCPPDSSTPGRSCPCCGRGGCPCVQPGPARCVQCGLEGAGVCLNGELNTLYDGVSI